MIFDGGFSPPRRQTDDSARSGCCTASFVNFIGRKLGRADYLIVDMPLWTGDASSCRFNWFPSKARFYYDKSSLLADARRLKMFETVATWFSALSKICRIFLVLPDMPEKRYDISARAAGAFLPTRLAASFSARRRSSIEVRRKAFLTVINYWIATVDSLSPRRRRSREDQLKRWKPNLHPTRARCNYVGKAKGWKRKWQDIAAMSAVTDGLKTNVLQTAFFNLVFHYNNLLCVLLMPETLLPTSGLWIK